MEAVALGDVRVACFVLLQERKGQDPARTLADGVIAAHKRAARPAPAPPATPASPGPPRACRDLDDRMIERVDCLAKVMIANACLPTQHRADTP